MLHALRAVQATLQRAAESVIDRPYRPGRHKIDTACGQATKRLKFAGPECRQGYS